MYSIEHLIWDSDFFQKKIYKVNITKDLSYKNLNIALEKVRKSKIDILYLFLHNQEVIKQETLNKYQGHLADEKIIFTKRTNTLLESSHYVTEYDKTTVNPNLLSLAYLSGKHSRFKDLTCFAPGDFEKLYKEWITQSVKKVIADKVFVYVENNSLLGFVTVRKSQKEGFIGLIAVNEDIQGRGIGSALLNQVNNYLFQENIYILHVPTQRKNVIACDFYRKNDFLISSIQNIYHFTP